jgi:hypothetical protein
MEATIRQVTTAVLVQEDIDVADHGNHGTKVEVYNGVSTEDEPSAAWGWHQFPRRTTIVIGYLGGLSMFGMLFGNHPGQVENIWLVAIGILVIVGTFLYARHSSPNWSPKPSRKTVTAHNKPLDHQEPDWAADQRNLTGAYANLTTAELRSWNLPGVGSDGVEKVETPKSALTH